MVGIRPARAGPDDAVPSDTRFQSAFDTRTRRRRASDAVSDRFSTVTTVTPAGPGRYEGSIHESWDLRPLPQGGIVTAIALRAMADLLDDTAQKLRSLHTTFVAQVAHGPVSVEVELLRRGRSMSHLRSEVTNPGAARGHVTTGIFGSARPGFTFTDLDPPAGIPPPAERRSYRDPRRREWSRSNPPRSGRSTSRDGRRSVTRSGKEYIPDRAETATWYRFDHPPFLDDGTLDPLALVVLADTMPGAVAEKVGRRDRGWFAPSADLTVHLLDHCRSPWVLAHNRARFAGDGYASADMALWDCGVDGAGRPRLVAYATQVFLFSFAT